MLTEKRGSMVEIRVPERGEKKRLIELACENAKEALDMMRVRWLADANKTDRRSNSCEKSSRCQRFRVASSVMTTRTSRARARFRAWSCSSMASPATNQYRRFKVKTVVGADDFATMQEIMRRRFARAARDVARADAARRTRARNATASQRRTRPVRCRPSLTTVGTCRTS